jgi:SAM-dependent methyltransferase
VCGDEEFLPFEDGTFDLIASALSLHVAYDLPGALIQARRALKPDGLFLCTMLGGATLEELRASFAQAETEIEGGLSPRVSPMADLRDLGGLLQRAGFALPVADSDSVTVTYATPLALMRDLRAMGATNVLAARRKAPLRRATLARAIEIYQENFAAPGGRIRATFEIVHLSGWSPHESQQRPLRPGSAKSRLADALGVEEHKLKSR